MMLDDMYNPASKTTIARLVAGAIGKDILANQRWHGLSQGSARMCLFHPWGREPEGGTVAGSDAP